TSSVRIHGARSAQDARRKLNHADRPRAGSPRAYLYARSASAHAFAARLASRTDLHGVLTSGGGAARLLTDPPPAIFLTWNCRKGAMQAQSLLLTTTHSLVRRHAPRRYDSVLFPDEWRREALSHSEAPVAAREHELETLHPRTGRGRAHRARH